MGADLLWQELQCDTCNGEWKDWGVNYLNHKIIHILRRNELTAWEAWFAWQRKEVQHALQHTLKQEL